jgi:cytoskeletal protein CcmA (bactofilin family)
MASAPTVVPPAPAAGPGAPPVATPRAGAVQDRGVSRRDRLRTESWRSNGAAKIVGDVDVGTAVTDGSVTIGGRLVADRFRARGTLEVVGEVRVAEALEVRGTFLAHATVRAGDLALVGTAHATGGIAADRSLSGRGSLAASSLLAGAIEYTGEVEVPNTIEAWRVDLALPGSSRLGAVRAHVARIRGKVPNLVEQVLQRRIFVEIERVEADEVTLEGVDVSFVRSPKLVLGRGAHVTNVEGSIVAQHATASVGPRSESPPPHGLRR